MSGSSAAPASGSRILSPWCGTWKRTLSQESFGPFFARQRDNTVFVSIEPIYEAGAAAAAAASAAAAAAAAAAATSSAFSSSSSSTAASAASSSSAAAAAAPVGLRWSFGASAEALRHGFSLSVAGAPAAAAPPAPAGWRRLALTACTGEGVVREDGGAISLQLFGTSFAAIVYRMLDEDTLAVSVTELPSPADGERPAALAARDKAVANVQHGYMFRVL